MTAPTIVPARNCVEIVFADGGTAQWDGPHGDISTRWLFDQYTGIAGQPEIVTGPLPDTEDGPECVELTLWDNRTLRWLFTTPEQTTAAERATTDLLGASTGGRC